MITTPYRLEELDRSVYEIIRREVVAMGYLPDITQYATAEEYEAAKVAVIANKGYVIEVLGVGAGEGRGERTICSITIDRQEIGMGSIGGGTIQHRPENNGFTRERLPQTTSDIMYDIRIYTNSITKERMISDMIYGIINHRNYYKIAEEYNQNSDKGFFAVSKGDVSLSKNKQLERLFKFEIQDVWIGRNSVERRNIVPLTSVVYRLALKDSTDDVEIVEVS